MNARKALNYLKDSVIEASCLDPEAWEAIKSLERQAIAMNDLLTMAKVARHFLSQPEVWRMRSSGQIHYDFGIAIAQAEGDIGSESEE